MIWPIVGGASSPGGAASSAASARSIFPCLQVEPFLLMLFGGPVAALIDDENRRIHDAIGERLQPQRVDAGLEIRWDDFAAAGQVIEIFENDRRIEDRAAVIEDENGDFAERILLAHRIGRILGRGRFDFDLAIESKHAHGDAGLAAERGTKTRPNSQHGQRHLLLRDAILSVAATTVWKT